MHIRKLFLKKVVPLFSLIRIVTRGLRVDETYAITGKLWMVNLGGSEQILKTQASGQTMEEAKAINLSLSALEMLSVYCRENSLTYLTGTWTFGFESMKRIFDLLADLKKISHT